MATRSIPPSWFKTDGPTITNITIVNFNPHDTICPLCWQYVGRVYTYRPGAPYPPPLPLHEHCYCWYDITEEPSTVWQQVPTPPGDPWVVPIPPESPWMPAPIPDPAPAPIWEQVPTPPGSPWSPFAATPAVYPEPEEPEEPGYPAPGFDL